MTPKQRVQRRCPFAVCKLHSRYGRPLWIVRSFEALLQCGSTPVEAWRMAAKQLGV